MDLLKIFNLNNVSNACIWKENAFHFVLLNSLKMGIINVKNVWKIAFFAQKNTLAWNVKKAFLLKKYF